MSKRRLPNKDVVFETLKEELMEQGILISGDIEKFKVELHRSFKQFLGKREYKDKYLFEFVFIAVDDLLEEDIPSQVSDNAPQSKAAK